MTENTELKLIYKILKYISAELAILIDQNQNEHQKQGDWVIDKVQTDWEKRTEKKLAMSRKDIAKLEREVFQYENKRKNINNNSDNSRK